MARATLEPDPADGFHNVDVEVQKLRVEQMRRLRKELRKLEKLERLRLNKAVGGSPSVDAELLRQINTDAENSFDSVSTANTTDVSVRMTSSAAAQMTTVTSLQKGASSSVSTSKETTTPSTRLLSTESTRVMSSLQSKSDARLVVEGRSATSDSDANKKGKKPMPPPTNKKPTKTSRTSSKSTPTAASQNPPRKVSDFGQTCPTPLPSESPNLPETVEKGVLTGRPEGEPNQSCSGVDTDADVRLDRPKRRKPIAFYLPVDNQSPIVIGTRTLREKRQEDFLGKENRSILANYMAGIESGVTRLKRKTHPTSASESPRPDPSPQWTLQESLARKRPDFIASADYRANRLHEMKQKRLEYEQQVSFLTQFSRTETFEANAWP